MSPSTQPLPRLLRYARSHRRRIALAAAASVLNKLFDLAPPLLIGAAVDVLVRGEDSGIAALGLREPMAQITAIAVATFVIWGLESIFEYAYALLWRNLAQTLQHELRLDAYGHVQGLEMAWFEERSTGGLMSILNDDVNQLERFLDVGANDLLQVATTALATSAVFFYLAPEVAWLSMLPIPLIVWGSVRFQSRLAPLYTDVRERVGLLNARLAGNLSGIATIKSYTAEEHESARVQGESEAYRDSNARAIALSSVFVPMIRMVIVMGFLATLVFGARLAIDGKLEVGAYSVLVFLTQRLLWPMTRLGQTFDLYQRAMASTTRILDLLDTPARIRAGGDPFPRADVRGEVEFAGVSFAYGGGPPVLRDLSLVFRAGETTAIVGATGSGKSTVLKLLLRFYDASEGRVLVDGRDITALELGDVRSHVGLVSQDVFLFHGTVRENIEYGRRGATDGEIMHAARTAEAHEFIERLPAGYDTVVGERGQKLSGGQRQRISLARALLKDPPILVLDEATSSVDNETEAAIQRSLERIAADRTVVVVAHRLSTVRNAHKIAVLEEGRIREEGLHDELVSRGGPYAALWRVQTGFAAGEAEVAH